jgi:hypothetical protein
MPQAPRCPPEGTSNSSPGCTVAQVTLSSTTKATCVAPATAMISSEPAGTGGWQLAQPACPAAAEQAQAGAQRLLDVVGGRAGPTAS